MQDENATIATDCEWTKNRNFMTRSFAMVVGDQVNRSGMQIVGWDPVAKQIRSWVFDSDGGFSEGTWKRKGEKWIVQQKGTLPDGGTTSATNIFKHVDDNSFTWQSIDRTGGRRSAAERRRGADRARNRRSEVTRAALTSEVRRPTELTI